MQVITDPRATPPALKGAVLALGNFDGVHLGHRVVIQRARAVARDLGAPVGVVTFEPHPRQLFRPDDPPFRLTLAPAKQRLLAALGLDLLVVLTFDRAFSETPAERFITDVLRDGLGARHVIAGHDFHFGHRRGGNPQMLEASGAAEGFGVDIVGPQQDVDGTVFSASAIRDHLRAARPRDAARLLGRDWAVEGVVQRGDQRGRTLGFPTANLALGAHLRPAYGVYAVRVSGAGLERPRDGVASLGIRPMWETAEPMLEAHLFDYAGDLYGLPLAVELVAHLRPEARFDSLAALVDQMHADSRAARAALAA